MSDNWIIFVPVDPYASPEVAAVEAARHAIAQRLPDSDDVTVEIGENPRFVDAGANFESVTCPSCGSDLLEWWPGAMDHAHEGGFADLSVVTPCCSLATTLNDLRYDWLQAFARVSIHAMNPNVNELPPGLQHDVERLLGLPTRVVWQHL